MAERVDRQATHPAGGTVTVIIDGQAVQAYAGDTVAAVLYGLGRRAWRRPRSGGTRSGGGRGILCGMGICFDCLVTVDGAPGLRACQTLVQEGMRIDTSLDEVEQP